METDSLRVYSWNLIYPGVAIGADTTIEEPCVIGKPARGYAPGELPTAIGVAAVIRPFTTVYSGVEIGDRFQTGQGVSIRENNVIGADVGIGTNSVLEHGNRIGDRVRIHTGCFLELVTVEEGVFIGPNVVFTDDPHPPCDKYEHCVGGAYVRSGAKIGANSTILPGVIIGKNALVGAGSVVTADVPDDSVVAGNPARVLKSVGELKCHKGFSGYPYPGEAARPSPRKGEANAA